MVHSPEAVQRCLVAQGLAAIVFACTMPILVGGSAKFAAAIGAAHVNQICIGLMQAVVGLAVPLIALPTSRLVALNWLLTVGAWAGGLGYWAGAITGQSSPVTPMLNAKGAVSVSSSSLMHVSLMVAAPTILASLCMAIAGISRGVAAAKPAAKKN